MIDFDNIRTIIVQGLTKYLGCPVIRSNQNAEPPKYPYVSYTVITPVADKKGTYGEYDDDISRKPITQTWSITIQSDDNAESVNLAAKAREWLDYVGTTYLNDNHIIVQSVGAIGNRDNFLTVEYQYRNGFDVVFWLLNEEEKPIAETGYIETVELGDAQITPPPTEDELMRRFEERLSGR